MVNTCVNKWNTGAEVATVVRKAPGPEPQANHKSQPDDRDQPESASQDNDEQSQVEDKVSDDQSERFTSGNNDETSAEPATDVPKEDQGHKAHEV